MHLALSDMDFLSRSMARIGHSGMTADEVTENVEAAVKTVMEKIRMVSVEDQRVVCSLCLKALLLLFHCWSTVLSEPVPSVTLLTGGISDEGHPHQESGVSGSPNLQLRAEPPLSTREGEANKNSEQKRGKPGLFSAAQRSHCSTLAR